MFAPGDNNRAQWLFMGSPGYIYSRPTLPNLPPTRAFVPDQNWSVAASEPAGAILRVPAMVPSAVFAAAGLGVMEPSGFDFRTQDRQCLAAGGRCRDTRVPGAVPPGYGARLLLCPSAPSYVRCVVPVASQGGDYRPPSFPTAPSGPASQSNVRPTAPPTDALPGTYTTPGEGAPRASSRPSWLMPVLYGAGALVLLGGVVALVTKRKPNRSRRRRRNAKKDPACMTASEINKALDRLDAARSKLNAAFIAAGRGHETFSETRRLTDPLAMKAQVLEDEHSALRREIQLRYGPGAPYRLPLGRGFGPRRPC